MAALLKSKPIAGNASVEAFESRAYQLEMLQESLQRNIIVAMDTGSGKTHIAVLRIEAELEKCAPEKLVWFLCPTITLAEQQYDVVTSHLRSVQSRLLTGNDGVDRWGEKQIWDGVLQDIKIVVSTHKVLLDALIHGFVSIARIALLVFDECHNCTGNHPANRIMQEFYHPNRGISECAPHILGLTASPIINNKTQGLENIEQNINAISKTPKIHRDELVRFVHLPQMIDLLFPEYDRATQYPPLLQNLLRLCSDVDIKKDPYVVKLLASGHGSDSEPLRKALMNRKTYCQEQIKRLSTMAINVHEELGAWASHHYVSTCLSSFLKRRFQGPVNFDYLEEDERSYLVRLFEPLAGICIDDSETPDINAISPKASRLLGCLARELQPGFAGLVFVKTRASVELLAQLISVHPITKAHFSVGTFVGTSMHEKRNSSIGDLHRRHDQTETLDNLRYGKKNLIIATSVLEEGIDVSACNVVICFEQPPNLKSFIQRRGRARSSKSKYIIMFGDSTGQHVIRTWQQLEEEMKQLYMDDMRQLEELRKEVKEERDERVFMVESTGARITPQDAVPHLHHWCAKLPQTQYADPKPLFMFKSSKKSAQIQAEVVLPKSVDKAVREAKGTLWWDTEKAAKRDVAFVAYVALFHAGLVNDHLLPLAVSDEAALRACSEVEKRPALVTVRALISPWTAVAMAWQSGSMPYQTEVQFDLDGSALPPVRVISSFALPQLGQLILFLDFGSTLKINFGSSCVYAGDVDVSDNITRTLLSAIYSSKVESDRAGFTLRFEPFINVAELQNWLTQVTGTRPASTLHKDSPRGIHNGIIRDSSTYGSSYIFHGIEYQPLEIESSTDAGHSRSSGPAMELAPFLQVTKLSKRSDFLHPIASNEGPPKTKGFKYLSPSTCSVDNLPFAYSQCAMYIPCIIHRIEISLVTQNLCESLLLPVCFEDRQLVTTAITASSACEAYNYQSLELLGDSCLKLCASLNIAAEHINWHEGYLSHQKDHIVSNGRLALCCQQTGLDKYILTKPFTGYRWKPLYNEEALNAQSTGTRELSTKTLADVVEALLGAAFVDGSYPKVLACLSTFLPEISWRSLNDCRDTLLQAATQSEACYFPPHFVHLETLLGYQFSTKSLLLEALTHPSHLGPDTTPSYQRLEFIGDSILDTIITTRVFRHSSSLKHFRMHLLRTALVNANFLAFVGMRHSLSVPRTNLPVNTARSTDFAPDSAISLSIWHFMRHSHSLDIVVAQNRCQARFLEYEPAISEALADSDSYPWTLMTALEPEKFFSDLIESVLAAIFLDSAGSFSACETFLTVIGILPYLDRALNNDIRVMHPKEELGVAAGNERVEYHVVAVEETDDAGEKGYKCTVTVGGNEMAQVCGSRTRIEAETRAAAEAIKVLREQARGNAQLMESLDPEHGEIIADEHMATADADDERNELQGVAMDGVANDGDDLNMDRDDDSDGDVRIGGCTLA